MYNSINTLQIDSNTTNDAYRLVIVSGAGLVCLFLPSIVLVNIFCCKNDPKQKRTLRMVLDTLLLINCTVLATYATLFGLQAIPSSNIGMEVAEYRDCIDP
jgi:hypothetical protein